MWLFWRKALFVLAKVEFFVRLPPSKLLCSVAFVCSVCVVVFVLLFAFVLARYFPSPLFSVSCSVVPHSAFYFRPVPLDLSSSFFLGPALTR